MYEVLVSKNVSQDLAAIKSIDMFDKNSISDIAETIKIAAKKKGEVISKASEEKRGGKKTIKKIKKQQKKYTLRKIKIKINNK